MNRFLTFILCMGTLAVSPALFAVDTFFGKATFAMTNNGERTTINYFMKGSTVRAETEGMPNGVIMDFAKMKMILLMSERHMYMIMPLKPEKGSKEIEGNVATADGDIEVTGKTEKILGYLCNQVLVKIGGDTTELWAAEGLGTFAGLGSQFGGNNSIQNAKWEQALQGKGGFPLRMITRNKDGKETSKIEATKIEKGGVTDADFQPPADFKEFQMPNLGGKT